MARTGENENKDANKQYQAQQTKAFDTGQKGVADYNQNIANLEAGKAVAADPWKNPEYLASQNRLSSDSLNSVENASKAQLSDLDARTGGLNSGVKNSAIISQALQKSRLANQLSAGRSADDYNKNVQYQMQVAGMPLAAAGAETPFYGAATSGRSSSLDNLAKLGIAAYGPWQTAIAAAGQAASAGLSGGGGGKKP